MKEYKTEYYYVRVDVESNMIIIKPIGFWPSIDIVPKYLGILLDSIDDDLREDFGLIYDISEMKAHPPEVRDKIHIKGVYEIARRKPKGTAVVSPISSIAKMQIALISKTAVGQTPAKEFTTLEEAVIYIKEFISK